MATNDLDPFGGAGVRTSPSKTNDGLGLTPDDGLRGGRTTTDGFSDPKGNYPSDQHINSSSLNKAATGSKRNDLYVNATDNVDLKTSEGVQSEYPYNQVQESRSGHVIEIDDTPGNQRILIMHNSRAGVEISDNGSITISSRGRKIEFIEEDETVIVEGDGNLVYKGNLTIRVDGDLDFDVKGNYNLNVAGNKTESIKGSDRSTVGGSVGQVVSGGYSITSVGQVTNTFLGGLSTNVKGTFSNNVDGDANFLASGTTVLTSEGDLIGAADNMTLTAQDMTVASDTGTVGGENVIMYNYNMHTGHTVWAGDTVETQTVNAEKTVNADKMTATEFVGDLTGRADEAIAADTAQAASTGGSPTPSPNGWTNSTSSASDQASDTKATALPTSSLLSSSLGKTAAGIRRVKIDDGDFIKKFIDKTEDTGGISNTPMTPNKARSRMRDPANRSNNTFVSNMMADGIISPDHVSPAPIGIGRRVSGDPTPVISGPIPPGGKSFVFGKGTISVIPQLEYNPIFVGQVTAKTKVGPGISVAKFLGSSDDPTNLDFIRDNRARVQLAKYLTIHASIMKTVNSTDAGSIFDNVRLVVSEGVYRPGPNETMTPGGINELKYKGRAIVYNLVDINGKSSLSKMFDLAAYWKDVIPYDQLILSYDTIDGKLNCRIIVILPELDDDWEGNFRRDIITEYNNQVYAKNELVECLPFQSTTLGKTFDAISLDAGGEYGINIASTNPIIDSSRPSETSTYLQPGSFDRFKSLLQNEYTLLQQYFGGKVYITDGLAKTTTSRKPPTAESGSQHFYGRAIDVSIVGMSNDQKIKLVKAGMKAGFTGIGLGQNIIHFDTRGYTAKWFYGATTRYGISVSDWRDIIDKGTR